LGRYIENKLGEKNEKNKSKHSIEELLGLPLVNNQQISGAMFGNKG